MGICTFSFHISLPHHYRTVISVSFHFVTFEKISAEATQYPIANNNTHTILQIRYRSVYYAPLYDHQYENMKRNAFLFHIFL